MYKANNELKFTYRIICDKEFDISSLKEQFPILSKKDMIKTKEPHLSIVRNRKKFVVCIHNFYIANGGIDEKILKDKIEVILSILTIDQQSVFQQLIISILPQTDQFGIEIPIKILNYLSSNDINLSLSGIFLC